MVITGMEIVVARITVATAVADTAAASEEVAEASAAETTQAAEMEVAKETTNRVVANTITPEDRTLTRQTISDNNKEMKVTLKLHFGDGAMDGITAVIVDPVTGDPIPYAPWDVSEESAEHANQTALDQLWDLIPKSEHQDPIVQSNTLISMMRHRAEIDKAHFRLTRRMENGSYKTVFYDAKLNPLWEIDDSEEEEADDDSAEESVDEDEEDEIAEEDNQPPKVAVKPKKADKLEEAMKRGKTKKSGKKESKDDDKKKKKGDEKEAKGHGRKTGERKKKDKPSSPDVEILDETVGEVEARSSTPTTSKKFVIESATSKAKTDEPPTTKGKVIAVKQIVPVVISASTPKERREKGKREKAKRETSRESEASEGKDRTPRLKMELEAWKIAVTDVALGAIGGTNGASWGDLSNFMAVHHELGELNIEKDKE
ncbi:uncharacterized protein LOC129593557 [Paramacrobiotus metropolitanus]|uniref:uncharacterized protein LOC129593557 n=1 Tax=Paramacrobiotus metropolitanus TaxID=2943436 RepID=UPI0024458ADA|nr:uncharacterized protein LOC129593557 [Paramacrobiotus metropolitanus]